MLPLAIIENYIQQLFEQEKQREKTLLFHNYEHTRAVVETVQQIAHKTQLETSSTYLLTIAAWFHDIGYLYTYHKHEAKGIEMAKHFLSEHLSLQNIQIITDCIAATEVGVEPKDDLQAILKDADLAFGATNDFEARGDALRKEWQIHLDRKYSDEDWIKVKVQHHFLSTLIFRSAYGKEFFAPLVQQNFEKYFG